MAARDFTSTADDVLNIVHDDLVDVAPFPVFSRFKGLHEGMMRGVKVFGGVFIFGRITAADMSARQTQAKVYPAIAHFETFLTAFSVGAHVMHLIKMRTLFHKDPLSHCETMRSCSNLFPFRYSTA
jgi:hypothetical protein